MRDAILRCPVRRSEFSFVLFCMQTPHPSACQPDSRQEHVPVEVTSSLARRAKALHTLVNQIMRQCLVLVLFLTLSSVAVAAKAAKIIAKKGPGGFSANGFGKKTATLSPTVKLNTGADIPMLGFGTYRTGGPELQVALRHAIAAGYRHLDTASCYNNEAIVGAALKESGLPRKLLHHHEALVHRSRH
jgi:hypothetical protein